MFSAAGILGAIVGSTLGKAIDGQRLLLLFAILMLVVGAMMFRSRDDEGDPGAECTIEKAPKVVGYGAVTGAFSGFFGIGSGFLIVPGLIASTGDADHQRGRLLARRGLRLRPDDGVELRIFRTRQLAAGCHLHRCGIVGGQIGCLSARRLSSSKGALKLAFAGLIVVVALYMGAKSMGRL